MPIQFLEEEMRAAIRSTGRKPLIVCGAGVSKAATGDAPTWAQLIASGIERAAALDRTSAAQAWAEGARRALAGADTAEMIAIADELTARLGGADNKEFADWLAANIGGLAARDDTLLRAILALDCPLATTNYDDILAKAANCGDVCWSESSATLDVLRGERKGVLHLHGHWRNPTKVILGQASYAAHGTDPRRALMQQFQSLDRPTIFIGCSEDGLNDPDFARLSGWLREWQDAAPRRYWLVPASAASAPNFGQRLFPVVYGDGHGDLVPFLRSCAPPAASPLPPDPAMLGRVTERDQVAAAMLAHQPVVIPGGPGMGKSTLALAAAHLPDVAAHFGAARHFVRLDAANDGEAVTRVLAVALSLPATGAAAAIRAAVAGHCAGAPVLAILDNAETPHQKDADGTETELAHLAAIAGLALVVTVRGAVPRFALGARLLMPDVAPLGDAEARALFRRNAPGIAADDPDLPALLAAMDGHPLSLELVGRVAEGETRVAPVLEMWQRHRADLLRNGAGDTRLTSVRASLRLSLESPAMTDAARRLVSLLALMPAGMHRPDAGRFVEGGDLAAGVLLKLRLASAAGDRLAMLAPLREAARAECEATEEDFGRLWAAMAGALEDAEASMGGDAIRSRATVEREADNLDRLLGEANARKLPLDSLTISGHCLAEFHRLTGLASVATIAQLVARAISEGADRPHARCLLSLGNVALLRWDLAMAQVRFNDALPLYRRLGIVLREADCIQGMGDVALRLSELIAARGYYDAAKLLYRQVSSVNGEVNCLRGLGDIALRRFEYGAARDFFEEALPLSRQAADLIGEANCIASLGEIAQRQSDLLSARRYFNGALPLFRRLGSAQGEANCIASFGEIALACSDFSEAKRCCEEALPIYRRVGDVLGAANCISCLGEVALRNGEIDKARLHLRNALEQYENIPEHQSIGFAHLRLARLAPDATDRRAHRQAARAAWASIGRKDLIAEHLSGED